MNNEPITTDPNSSSDHIPPEIKSNTYQPKSYQKRNRFSKLAIPWSMIVTFLIISSFGMSDKSLWEKPFYQNLLNTLLTAAIALSQATVDD